MCRATSGTAGCGGFHPQPSVFPRTHIRAAPGQLVRLGCPAYAQTRLRRHHIPFQPAEAGVLEICE